jgi:hypothetical protein
MSFGPSNLAFERTLKRDDQHAAHAQLIVESRCLVCG